MFRLLTGVLLLGLSAAVFAGTTVPYPFSAGTQAKADEVNANFQALVTAIDTLASRVGKLEGTVTAADVAGTYAWIEFSVTARALTTGANGEWKVEHTNWKGVLTLKSDNTFTLSKPGSRTLLGWNSLNGVSSSEESPAENLGGTWDISGNKLTLTIGGSPGQLIMAAGPSLFVTAYKDQRMHSLVLVVRDP